MIIFPACGVGYRAPSSPEPEGSCWKGVSRPGLATRSPDQVPGIFFTIHFFFEDRSFVDFDIGNESVGAVLKNMTIFKERNALRVKQKTWNIMFFI